LSGLNKVTGPHPIIAKCLTVLAMATVAAIALGFVTAEPAGEQNLQLNHRETLDPLWPEHLRCLVLGTAAAHDRICIALAVLDRKG